MGGIADSAGGFLGLSGGPKAPAVQSGNPGLQSLIDQNMVSANGGLMPALQGYENGTMNSDQAINYGLQSPSSQMGIMDSLATSPLTGTKFATDQVQNNPLMAGLYGQNGVMNAMTNNLQNEVGQGYSLQPQDATLYGQAAGGIARQYGQAGNDAANNLASRGLSSSGAAGAQFSGLQGSQNEQLAQAQQNIMQQRFQNTMQQASAVNQMSQGAQNAVNQQYGRNLSGVQQQEGSLATEGGLSTGANASANNANMNAANFEQQNKPQNAFDMVQGGLNSAMGAGSKSFGQGAGNAASVGLFG